MRADIFDREGEIIDICSRHSRSLNSPGRIRKFSEATAQQCKYNSFSLLSQLFLKLLISYFAGTPSPPLSCGSVPSFHRKCPGSFPESFNVSSRLIGRRPYRALSMANIRRSRWALLQRDAASHKALGHIVNPSDKSIYHSAGIGDMARQLFFLVQPESLFRYLSHNHIPFFS